MSLLDVNVLVPGDIILIKIASGLFLYVELGNRNHPREVKKKKLEFHNMRALCLSAYSIKITFPQ